jgi:hypothetical protein
MSPILVWHHRLLGVLWALAGLAFIVDLRRAYWWEQGRAWLPVLIGTGYTTAGIGFALALTWARRVLAGLVVMAGLFFADMVLLCGFAGNREGMYWMLGACGLAAYTFSFIFVSAVSMGTQPEPGQP